jgi:hypothetical protein
MSQDFNELYYKELQPTVDKLDSERQFGRNLIIFAGLLFFVAFYFYWQAELNKAAYEDPRRIGRISIYFFAGGAVMCLWGYSVFKNFKKTFKELVTKKIIEKFFPMLSYDGKSGLSSILYTSSNIFRTHYDRYIAEDLIQGKLGSTYLEFSEVHTQYKTTTYTSKGGTRTQWHTIFKGVFVFADFHKNLLSETYVFPDVAESWLGNWVGGALQKLSGAMSNRGQRQQLDNPEFESKFVVYGKDPQETRYVLTPKMMESILRLETNWGSRPYFSFKDGKVYIALPTSKDFFDPPFWTKVSFTELVQTIENVKSIIAIVEELDLNTRIWSKV